MFYLYFSLFNKNIHEVKNIAIRIVSCHTYRDTYRIVKMCIVTSLVINHSTLAYVCHYPGADCHQSSTIPPWPMCVTIEGQTATSHQPFHPGLCVSLSRGRLPPVINHSTLAYVCHYPGTDCHQSSTIPPWPMCVTIQGPPWLSDFISQLHWLIILVNVHFVMILLQVCVQAFNMICLTVFSSLYPIWGWLDNLWKGWAMRGNNA